MTTATATLGAEAATDQPAGATDQPAGATPADAGATAGQTDVNPTDTGAAEPRAQRVDWLGDAAEDLHAFARANGYKGPADAISNVRELQKYLGADKAGRGVVIPKDADDAEGWQQLYARLGRPESPEGYGLEKLEGADPAFAAEAAKTFHELGLNDRQAAALTQWWGKAVTGRAEADEGAYLAKAEAEMAALKSEWGQQASANEELARRGARAFGFSPEELDKIERSVGTKALMARFLEVGRKLGEDTLPAGRQGAAPLTKAAAEEQIAQKMQDKDFMAKVKAGDGAAKREMDRLFQAAYPS